jgi:hypothetical protein
MELTEERQRQLDKIKRDITCHFDFKCEKSDFKSYPKVRSMGELLQCNEDDDAKECGHSLSFGHGFLCRCPLMKYIRNSNSGTSF